MAVTRLAVGQKSEHHLQVALLVQAVQLRLHALPRDPMISVLDIVTLIEVDAAVFGEAYEEAEEILHVALAPVAQQSRASLSNQPVHGGRQVHGQQVAEIRIPDGDILSEAKLRITQLLMLIS